MQILPTTIVHTLPTLKSVIPSLQKAGQNTWHKYLVISLTLQAHIFTANLSFVSNLHGNIYIHFVWCSKCLAFSAKK